MNAQITIMSNNLEERMLRFALMVRSLIKLLPKTISNSQDVKQLIRSSGSIGANYIEANEALSPKDFIHRIRISRKEAKETLFWLSLIETYKNQMLEDQRLSLINELQQLRAILSSIILKREGKR